MERAVAEEDEHWMRRALELASRAAREGEVPVGAVIVRGGVEVGAGANAPIRDADPTAHAEINAIRAASRATGNYRLVGTTLYATLEPCVMCAGAIVHARIDRVVYGAADERWGGAGSVFDVLGCDRLNHRPAVRSGVLGEESALLLLEFFRARRVCGGGRVCGGRAHDAPCDEGRSCREGDVHGEGRSRGRDDPCGESALPGEDGAAGRERPPGEAGWRGEVGSRGEDGPRGGSGDP